MYTWPTHVHIHAHTQVHMHIYIYIHTHITHWTTSSNIWYKNKFIGKVVVMADAMMFLGRGHVPGTDPPHWHPVPHSLSRINPLMRTAIILILYMWILRYREARRSAFWVTLGGRSHMHSRCLRWQLLRARQQIASSSLFSSSLPSERSVLYGQISASSNNRQSNKLNLQNNRDLFVQGVSELVSGGSLCFPGH